MRIPSMDVIQSHMQNDADIIAEAGGDTNPETMTMIVASD